VATIGEEEMISESSVGAPPTLGLAYALGEFLKNSDLALLYLSIFTSNSNTITSLPRNKQVFDVGPLFSSEED
jgi:hypothetical protein